MNTRAPARPVGITIMAAFAAVGGVMSLILGIGLMGLGSIAGAVGGSGSTPFILGVVFIALGALYLAFAGGAWMLRPWAWRLGMAAAVVGIVAAIVNFLMGDQSIISLVINLAINGGILYYLNTPDIRNAFNRPSTGWR
jgi:hypothetical protein